LQTKSCKAEELVHKKVGVLHGRTLTVAIEVNCDASYLQLLSTTFTSFPLTLNLSIITGCTILSSKMSIVYKNIYVKRMKSTQIYHRPFSYKVSIVKAK